MKYVVTLLVFLLTPIVHATERQIAVVGAEFWVSPRNGEVVLNDEPIASAVRLLITDPEAYLVLHHPDSEFGELWGLELQAWLVSLGVVSDRLELRAGLEEDGVALILVTSDPEPQAEVQSVGGNTNESKAAINIPSQNEVELQ